MFFWDLHTKYILGLDDVKDSLEHLMSEHLRMGAIYWGVSALALMGRLTDAHKKKIVTFVQSCRNEDGSYSPNVGHDAHITSTHVTCYFPTARA
jgi:geranylgeranyl transferase type-2 subunit beta